MATEIKRLSQNGVEFVPITLSEAVVVNRSTGNETRIDTLDKVLREIFGNESNLNNLVDTINTTLSANQTTLEQHTALIGANTQSIEAKQDKLTAGNGITIAENESGQLIISSNITFELFKVVAEKPVSGESNYIYLVPTEGGIDGNSYTEFIWNNGAWEELGKIQTQVDLSGYVTETTFNNKVTLIEGRLGTVEEDITSLEENLGNITGNIGSIQTNIITTSSVTTSTGSPVKVDYDIPSTLYDSAVNENNLDYII